MLTGTSQDLRLALRKLGLETDAKEQHSNVFIMGNLTTGLWKKVHGLGDSREILRLFEEVLEDPVAASTRSTSHTPGPDMSTGSKQRGKRIYDQGTSPSGAEMTAVLGTSGTPIPASLLPCRGRTRKTRGRHLSVRCALASLTKPYGATDRTGQWRPPYDEKTLRRAITMGVDSAGRTLDAAMPRYRMTLGDLDDLITYMKAISSGSETGITDTTIRVGALLPPEASGRSMLRATLTAYASMTNDRGGIFGRRNEWVFCELPKQAKDQINASREFLEREQPFVLAFAEVGNNHGSDIGAVEFTVGRSSKDQCEGCVNCRPAQCGYWPQAIGTAGLEQLN